MDRLVDTYTHGLAFPLFLLCYFLSPALSLAHWCLSKWLTDVFKGLNQMKDLNFIYNHLSFSSCKLHLWYMWRVLGRKLNHESWLSPLYWSLKFWQNCVYISLYLPAFDIRRNRKKNPTFLILRQQTNKPTSLSRKTQAGGFLEIGSVSFASSLSSQGYDDVVSKVHGKSVQAELCQDA